MKAVMRHWRDLRWSREQSWQIRAPDHSETQQDATLQIWGDEGYWHIVDAETCELLAAVRRPVTWESLALQRPDWAGEKEKVTRILESVTAGLRPPPKPAEPRIENVSFNLTTGCNLHCATCYVPPSARTAEKLNPGPAMAFLERLGRVLSATATISLLGGEPFLHPEGVFALADWAQKRRLGCNVSTNGTVPLPAVLPRIRQLDLRVQVSIDGACARTNDALRGPGTFDQALATARELIAARVPTTFCMVACQENEAEIEDYLRLASRLGASEARIIPLKRLGHAQNGRLISTPQRVILEKMCAAFARDPGLEKLCQSDLYAILRNLVQEGSRRPACGSGTQTLLVQPDGSVYPCLNSTMEPARLGTVADETAALLRKGAEWGRTLSLEKETHPCHPCAVKRWCLAGCPGETLHREGRLERPHWNCADLRSAVTYMMWRSSQETKAIQTTPTQIERTIL